MSTWNEVFKRGNEKIQIWNTHLRKTRKWFSVCETWPITPNKYIQSNVFRDRIEFPDLKNAAIDHTIYKVPMKSGLRIKQAEYPWYRNGKRNAIPIKRITADKEKLEYINAVTPLIDQGRLSSKVKTGWKNLSMNVKDDPNVEFDDQIGMRQSLNGRKKNCQRNTQLKTLRRKNISRYKGFR